MQGALLLDDRQNNQRCGHAARGALDRKIGENRSFPFEPRHVSTIVLFNKPYGVLSQFTPEGKWRALAEFIPVKDIYAAGRLDADSEGLLLLTGDGKLQAQIADPKHKLEKTYWAQVEGIPDETALDKLRAGIALPDFDTRAATITSWKPESLMSFDIDVLSSSVNFSGRSFTCARVIAIGILLPSAGRANTYTASFGPALAFSSAVTGSSLSAPNA